MSAAFIAVSASDRTEDWPFWFVAKVNQLRRNVFAEACALAGVERRPGVVLACRETAEAVAALANAAADCHAAT